MMVCTIKSNCMLFLTIYDALPKNKKEIFNFDITFWHPRILTFEQKIFSVQYNHLVVRFLRLKLKFRKPAAYKSI